MSKFKVRLVISLLLWSVIVIGALTAINVAAHRSLLGPKGEHYIVVVLLLGVAVVLLSSMVCRALNAGNATLVGFGFGGVIPIVSGWVVARLVDNYQTSWGHYWTPLDIWALALQVLLPSAIAGAITGFLQAKRAPE